MAKNIIYIGIGCIIAGIIGGGVEIAGCKIDKFDDPNARLLLAAFGLALIVVGWLMHKPKKRLPRIFNSRNYPGGAGDYEDDHETLTPTIKIKQKKNLFQPLFDLGIWFFRQNLEAWEWVFADLKTRWWAILLNIISTTVFFYWVFHHFHF